MDIRKKVVDEEIGSHPTPIAGRAQQDNCVLNQRTRIPDECRRLIEAAAKIRKADDLIEITDDFIKSSKYVNEDAAASINRPMAEDCPNGSIDCQLL